MRVARGGLTARPDPVRTGVASMVTGARCGVAILPMSPNRLRISLVVISALPLKRVESVRMDWRSCGTWAEIIVSIWIVGFPDSLYLF